MTIVSMLVKQITSSATRFYTKINWSRLKYPSINLSGSSRSIPRSHFNSPNSRPPVMNQFSESLRLSKILALEVRTFPHTKMRTKAGGCLESLSDWWFWENDLGECEHCPGTQWPLPGPGVDCARVREDRGLCGHSEGLQGEALHY